MLMQLCLLFVLIMLQLTFGTCLYFSYDLCWHCCALNDDTSAVVGTAVAATTVTDPVNIGSAVVPVDAGSAPLIVCYDYYYYYFYYYYYYYYYQ